MPVHLVKVIRSCVTLTGLLCMVNGADESPLFAAEPLVLTGATVHTVSGRTFSPGMVLLRDGKIAEVGESVSTTGAKPVDLSGLHLYPGLICLDSVLGLTEIESVRGTADAEEVGDYRPDVQSWIAVNPDSELIPVTRANGIAYFEPIPLGGIISGQSGLVAVNGWTSEQMTVQKPIGLHLFWPARRIRGHLSRVRRLFGLVL